MSSLIIIAEKQLRQLQGQMWTVTRGQTFCPLLAYVLWKWNDQIFRVKVHFFHWQTLLLSSSPVSGAAMTALLAFSRQKFCVSARSITPVQQEVEGENRRCPGPRAVEHLQNPFYLYVTSQNTFAAPAALALFHLVQWEVLTNLKQQVDCVV